jgi:hypothetical protein
MGDYSTFSTGHNRCVRNLRLEERTVLEWRPRVIALVLVLIVVAIAAGFVDFGTVVDNWEW